MAAHLEFSGMFKYLGRNSTTQSWKNGNVFLKLDKDCWVLESHLTCNPQMVYRRHKLSPNDVGQVCVKASRLLINFTNNQEFHFKAHAEGSLSLVRRFEEQVKFVLENSGAKLKSQLRSRAEVGSVSRLSPGRPALGQNQSQRSSVPEQRSPRVGSVLDLSPQTPGRVPVFMMGAKSSSMVGKNSPAEQRVPELPSPDLSPSPSPVRFTSVKENKRSRQEVNETSPDDESKENQHRGMLSPSGNQQSRRGDRQPLKVTSSAFYGSHASHSTTPTHFKAIKRYGGQSAQSSVTRMKRLSSDVSYSWNRTSTPSSTNNKPNTPALQGFANLGNTCYMNAILQSLFSLDTLVMDLLSLQKQLGKNLSPTSLAYAMLKLLHQKRRPHMPELQKESLRNFKKAISTSARRFSGSGQHDAHELLGQVLDQLKEEVLKIIKDNSSKKENGNGAHTEGPSPSRDLVLSPLPSGENGTLVELGKITISTPILSPTVQNFEFEVVHTIECLNCQEQVQKSEQFNDLSLDIPSTRLPGVPLTLQDALDVFLEKEQIEYTCEKCQHKKAEVFHRFTKLPRVLILHLKRYAFDAVSSNNSKTRQDVRIPRFITLRDHCDQLTQPHAPSAFPDSFLRSPAGSAPRGRARRLSYGDRTGDTSPSCKMRRLSDDLDASGEDLEPGKKKSVGSNSYEEDLELAIQLSKQESVSKPPESSLSLDLTEEEDEQLKQALALSIKEMESGPTDHDYITDNNNADNMDTSKWLHDQEASNISDIAESDLANMTMEEQLRLAINRSLAQSSPPRRHHAQSPSPHITPEKGPSQSTNKQGSLPSFSSVLDFTGKSPEPARRVREILQSDATYSPFKKPSALSFCDSQKDSRHERKRKCETSVLSDLPSDFLKEMKQQQSVGFDESKVDLTTGQDTGCMEGDVFPCDSFWEEADWWPDTAKLPEESAHSSRVEMDMEMERDNARHHKLLEEDSDRGFRNNVDSLNSSKSSTDSSSAGVAHTSSKSVARDMSHKREPEKMAEKDKVESASPRDSFDGKLSENKLGADGVDCENVGILGCSSNPFSSTAPSSQLSVGPGLTTQFGDRGSEARYTKAQQVKSTEGQDDEDSDTCLPDIDFSTPTARSHELTGKSFHKAKREADSEKNVLDLANDGEELTQEASGFAGGCDEDLVFDLDEDAKPSALMPSWSARETTPDKKATEGKKGSGTEEKENRSPGVQNGGNQQPAPGLTDKQLEEKIAQHQARATDVEKGNVPFSYRLVSVVSHLGASSTAGHYISDVFDMRKQAWYSYNDNDVQPLTSETEVRTSRMRSGYIFFYLSKEIYDEFCHKIPKGNEMVIRS